MEPYLVISNLNDFIFCPRSIYFHNLYSQVSKKYYHRDFQKRGLVAHKTIDDKSYTTAKSILQGIEVYSEKYKLIGKIDLFDTERFLLIERKKKIKKIYDGYVFQLYAQYFCLIEMGYQVKKIKLYSMDDNKAYPLLLPAENPNLFYQFEKLIKDINDYKLTNQFYPNQNKCKKCVYSQLCDQTEV